MDAATAAVTKESVVAPRSNPSTVVIAWRHGGPWERLFVVLLNFGVVHFIAVCLFVAYMSSRAGWPIELVWCVALAGILFPPFQQAFFVPLMSPQAIREGIRRGIADGTEQYYEILAKYKELFGHSGQLPGDRAWAGLYWTIFHSKLYVAILVGSFLIPQFGDLTPFVYAGLDLPVSFVLVGLTRLRHKTQFLEAQRRGFRLLELRQQAELATRRSERERVGGSRR